MRLVVGSIDGRPGLLAVESDNERPLYFVLVAFRSGMVTHIRDYRYARHVMAEARTAVL